MTVFTGSTFEVPPFDEAAAFPTLGPQVCAWIEANLVHGPGDLRGQPARLDDEKRALIYRTYEVYPADHPRAGRRRFRRVCISLRKGSAKTEFAAWIAAAELSPTAPVRCGGFDAEGEPIGGPVRDPYIPMVAYTEEQSEDLAYGALYAILKESRIAEEFDIGLERIMRVGGDGKAVALAAAPDSRDGARTTFQHFDETHRFTRARLKRAHKTMLANIPKRKLADAWSLETTTAPAPGEDSVAEDTMEYAAAVLDGRRTDAELPLFFFHRQASDGHDLTTPAGIRAAVLEASGPIAAWSDIDGIAAQWNDPTADLPFLERVWLNRLVRASERAFDVVRWRELAQPGHVIPAGAPVALGFDGSRHLDSTALIATDINTGFQQLAGLWERPPAEGDWEVPVADVKAAVAAAFARWEVWKLYADPPYWETVVDEWAGEFGAERVFKFLTRHWTKMADAVRAFANAIAAGELSHAGDVAYTRHVGNAYRMVLRHRQQDGQAVWVIQKERPDSPNKIDAAVAGVLSWQARRDALAAGIGQPDPGSVYDERAATEEDLVRWV